MTYPGNPPDSIWFANVTSLDQTSNCHFCSPITPHSTDPEWIPILHKDAMRILFFSSLSFPLLTSYSSWRQSSSEHVCDEMKINFSLKFKWLVQMRLSYTQSQVSHQKRIGKEKNKLASFIHRELHTNPIQTHCMEFQSAICSTSNPLFLFFSSHTSPATFTTLIALIVGSIKKLSMLPMRLVMDINLQIFQIYHACF